MLKADIFEASHTYKVKGRDAYFTFVEAQAGDRRYFKAYTAPRLDGEWKPLADTWDAPFAGLKNLPGDRPWTANVSHGELLRASTDEKLEVDPANVKLLFQGVSDADRAGKKYGDIPWRLGLLELAPPKAPADPPKPTSHTERTVEGWTVRVDDRLLRAPDHELGKRALRFLEGKLADIKVVVPADKVKELQAVTDRPRPDARQAGADAVPPVGAGWLKANGYSADLAKCVHLPRAADVPTRRNVREQPWVVLHELAHAYHDQVLGFRRAADPGGVRAVQEGRPRATRRSCTTAGGCGTTP